MMNNLRLIYDENANGDRRTTALYDWNGRETCTTLPGVISQLGVVASVQWFRNNDVNRNKD